MIKSFVNVFVLVHFHTMLAVTSYANTNIPVDSLGQSSFVRSFSADNFFDDGKSVDDERIILGVKVRPGEYPFHVSVQIRRDHVCGGSLLTSSCILTACHCVVQRIDNTNDFKLIPASEFSVLAGVVNLTERFLGYQRRASSVRQHPNCGLSPAHWIWDFGVIFVYKRFKLKDNVVEVIKLPQFTEDFSVDSLRRKEVMCTAMGWGSTKSYTIEGKQPDPIYPVILQKVQLQLMPSHFYYKYDDSKQVCALGISGADACQGDSGGPLLCGEDQILLATVSWGLGCGQVGFPGFYARVDIAKPWLQEMMRSLATRKASFSFIILVLFTLSSKVKNCHSFQSLLY